VSLASSAAPELPDVNQPGRPSQRRGLSGYIDENPDRIN
jgi:hypothetical protein